MVFELGNRVEVTGGIFEGIFRISPSVSTVSSGDVQVNQAEALKFHRQGEILLKTRPLQFVAVLHIPMMNKKLIYTQLNDAQELFGAYRI